MKNSAFITPILIGIPLLAISMLGGCVTKIRDSVQALPNNLSLAAHNANDKGYPDLAKIPPMPTDMKTDNDWAAHSNQLVAQRQTVEQALNARIPTAQDADMSWANPIKSLLETDPRAQPPVAQDDPLAWVARMRALLNIPTTQNVITPNTNK